MKTRAVENACRKPGCPWKVKVAIAGLPTGPEFTLEHRRTGELRTKLSFEAAMALAADLPNEPIACPFCGEEHKVDVAGSREDAIYFVRCRKCYCEGPSADSAKNAITRWNERK